MRPIPNLAKTLMRRLDTYHFVRPPPPSSLYCPNCLAVPLSRPRPRLSEKSALSALVRLLCDRRHFSITPSSIASDCSRQHGPAQGGARRQIGECTPSALSGQIGLIS